jgi:hypothetical protein
MQPNQMTTMKPSKYKATAKKKAPKKEGHDVISNDPLKVSKPNKK